MHPSEKKSAKASRTKTKTRSAAAELSRHLLRAEEEERRRISRELHDGTGQGLMVLRLYLGMLASESQAPESQAKVQEALRLLDHTVEDLRRIIGRLSPRVLEELGLLAAVRKAARDFSRSTGLAAVLQLPRELDALDHEIQVALYRSLQETLHNIAKHARAKSFTVHMERKPGSISLSVEDDGIGFPARRPSSKQAFGLLGMRERIAALQGTLTIRSKAGGGTRLRMTLPAAMEAPSADSAAAALPASIARAVQERAALAAAS